jgi:hypothetical protein
MERINNLLVSRHPAQSTLSGRSYGTAPRPIDSASR